MIKKIYGLLIALTTVVIAVSLVKGIGLNLVDSIFPEGDLTELTTITAQDWTDLEEGTGVYYTIPDDISSAQVLEITSNWDSVSVYLEDELLYSFSDKYHELGRASHWIDIPDGSNGKRIILASASGTESLGKTLQSGIYLGTVLTIRHHFLMKNLPTLLFAALDMVMACVVILILAVLRHKLSHKIIHGMWDLLAFTILNGIWLISDCGFLECFTARTGLWALISYITFMLMPVFVAGFARQILTCYRRFLYILAMASLGFTSISLALYLTRAARLGTLLIFHQIIMVLGFAAVFFICNYEIRRNHSMALLPIRNGTILMGIFVTLGILLYWQNTNTLYPLFFGFGFTCYIVCLTISVVQQAYHNLKKRTELKTYRKLAYTDAMTMAYNRSAFEKYQNGLSAGVQESAYVLFDINNLKLVNDTRGHQSGDDLIMRAAACICRTFENAGKCYRIGGDEFMAVLDNIHDQEDVDRLLERFGKHVTASNEQLTEDQVPLSIAYGYSLAGANPRSGTEMYEEADEWMYRRKKMMKDEYLKTNTA